MLIVKQSSNLDHGYSVARRIRLAQKERVELREDVMRIRKQREEISLRMDEIRIKQEEDNKNLLVPIPNSVSTRITNYIYRQEMKSTTLSTILKMPSSVERQCRTKRIRVVT